ncbi:MAG: signal peptidase I [Sphingomicrobium sp.]
MAFSLRHRRASKAEGSDADAKKDGGLLRFILTLALLAWFVRSFVVAPFSIPSGSMLPTLYIGDYLMVSKWPYGYSRYSFPWQIPSFEGRILNHLPKRGDVVVFHHPVDDADLIKRVIGLPGDTVQVRAGQLVLNGKAVPREDLPPFALPMSANSPCKVVPNAVPMVRAGTCLYPAYEETLPGGPSYTVLDQVDAPAADYFPATTVPDGYVFVMGDNRDDSADSRFQPVEHGVGFLPVENIIGRAMFTFWSTDGSASYLKPWTWFSALRVRRIGNGYTGLPE